MTTKEELEKLRSDIDTQACKLIEANTNQERIAENIHKTIKDYTQPKQYGRWKPKDEECYFYIGDNGEICRTYWHSDNSDLYRWSIGNVYKTEQQAEQALERMKIHTQLGDIALRLNRGQKIDWYDDENTKYFMYYDFAFDEICIATQMQESAECTYCLSCIFKDIAIAEIGEERLVKYLRGE